MGIFFFDYAPHSLDEWARPPRLACMAGRRFKKKDTHILDFDVTLPLGLKRLTSLIFNFAKGFLGFTFGQQPVRA